EEALAVVSADRCYVRVTPNPLFSQILDVFTYNTMDGSSTSGGNYSNGGGYGNNNNSYGNNNSSYGNNNSYGNSNYY
ncbi:MAG: hypothetical protein LBQ54_16050, partial [Planctomycetaceae bacterium]|nr:hypothetical protein [Planctomycetaceae bacterium]